MSNPINVPLSHGTLSLENVAEARKFISWFSFHNRAVAQVLSDELQSPKTADAEKVTALGFLNRDIAEMICAIEMEIAEAE